MTWLNRTLFHLYRIKKGFFRASRKVSAGITYGSAAKYNRATSFISYFIGWNLLGAMLLFSIFGGKDEITGKPKIQSFDEKKQKLIDDEEKAQKQFEEKRLKRKVQLELEAERMR